jgi:GNAT superfamily N-acetyltransferase
MSATTTSSPEASATTAGSSPERERDRSERERVRISRRSEEDRKALEAMYAEVFGADAALKNQERWRWQYDENPHCPPEGPEIWVAKEAATGTVLGQYATMPVRLRVKDRTLHASWGMDVMVRPNLQRMGVGSRLFLYWDRQVEASLGLGLSRASYTLFQKLAWEDVGPVPCYSKVLDPKALLKRRLGVVSSVAAPLLRLGLWLVFPGRRSRPGDVPVRRLEAGFGKDYDELWNRVAGSFDFIAERSSAYLEWKFRSVPHVRYDIVEARRGEGGELLGYAVLRMTERNGVPLALLVDWLLDPEDRATAFALLDAAIEWARQRDAARIQTFTFDERLASALAFKGFFAIRSPMQFCLRIHSDQVVTDEGFFRDRSKWHVTFGDSDQDREA